jgi:flagellar P-ring protein precursor FlgI
MTRPSLDLKDLSLAAAIVLGMVLTPAWARTRLEHFCSVQGQQEVKLTGLGLVVGLPGTGDGARNLPTVRALQAALMKMNQPTGNTDLKNADNVAIVMIEASVPKTGLRRGQKIDGYVSAISAKSLRGGRLLSSPLTSLSDPKTAVAVASGAITIEDVKLPNTGRLALGVDLLQNVTASFVNRDNDRATVTLLIDPAKASFWTSSEVANVINNEFTFEAGGEKLARSVGPGSVEVTIPRTYQNQPVEFIAQVLEVGIDTPHTQARVVVNSNSKTVIVTGEVEISPVVITHKNFNVEVGGAAQETPGPFIALSDGQSRQSPVQLQQLQTALNKLRVPNEDVIAIIRELHATGKLHAELIDK